MLAAVLLAALPVEIIAQVLSPTPRPYQTGFFDVELESTWPRDDQHRQNLAKSFTLPIYRRNKRELNKRSSHHVKEWARREKARVQTKYLPEAAALSPLKRKRQDGSEWQNPSPTPNWETGAINITNYLVDLEYYAPVQVGTPPQIYNVVLDTGSSDFWLASNDCQVSQCGNAPRYNATASNSSVDLTSAFTIRYGQGTAAGELYNDTVVMAGRNLTQGFAACSTVSEDMLSGNISGIMGLGFELLAQSKITPFWQNFFTQSAAENQTDTFAFPGFSFSLSRFINVTDAQDEEPGGIFTLGTLSNESFTGAINWIDLPNPEQASYWYIPMDAVLFNNTPVPGINHNTTRVAMDTGTTLIGGPSDVVSAIYALIPGSEPATGDYEGYWTYPCSSQFNLGLVFNNYLYNITDADFNLGIFEPATATTDAQCLGVFFDLDLSASTAAIISWVIGAAFLKNVYSIYRFSPNISIGLAHLNREAMADYYPAVSGSASLPYIHSGAPWGPEPVTATAQVAVASANVTSSAVSNQPTTFFLGLVLLLASLA